jgi:cell division protein FtsL
MRQRLTALSLFAAMISAGALYAISYDTRRIAAKVHALEKATERAEADIAAARAELSHLSRPDRIEPLARAMGMAQPTAKQFIDDSRLPRRASGAP